MSEILAGLFLILFFVIRFALPFIVVLGIAILLDRMQVQWGDTSGSADGVIAG